MTANTTSQWTFQDPTSPSYEPVDFTIPPENMMPQCDFFLEQYMRCVNSKNGLTHVDDCPVEGFAYKDCIECEKRRGITIRQRYNRDSTFVDFALDNIRDKLGIRSNNPDHKTYSPLPAPIVVKTNAPRE